MAKKTISEMQKFARSMGGECLSMTYVNSRSPLDWRCSNGHTFTKAWHRVLSRGFCGQCAQNERIQRYRERSVEKSGSVAEFPNLVEEWDKNLNGNMEPQNFSQGSNQRIVWRCRKDTTHVWETTIGNRIGRNSGCPFCSNQTSMPEIRILCELRYLFGNVISRHKIDNIEIDVFIPDLKLGIEYDGHWYHRNNESNDADKIRRLSDKGIRLVRVRQTPLQKIGESDICVEGQELTKPDLNKLVGSLSDFVPKHLLGRLNLYIETTDFQGPEEFRTLIDNLPAPFPENVLTTTHPHLIDEWDHEGNKPLAPENFTKGSRIKVKWICPKNTEHRYFASIQSRTRKGRPRGCPYCSGNRADKKSTLAYLFPQIFKQIHPTKNGDLKLQELSASSSKKIWWKCKNNHAYLMTVNDRTRKDRSSTRINCKECLSIAFKSPDIAREWDFSLNGESTPRNVTFGSSKKFWWKCSVGHPSYLATPKHRTKEFNSTGCPVCSGHQLDQKKSLQSQCADLVSEWNWEKNIDVIPIEIAWRSNKKVWWKCLLNGDHQWQARVADRTRPIKPSGCPFCWKVRKTEN